MRKVIKNNEPIPRFHGVASRRMHTQEYVTYLIPLNIIIGMFNKIATYFKYGHKLYDTGYTKGYEKGQEMGYRDAYRDADKEIERELEKETKLESIEQKN
jgi:hypothetical protein